MLLKEKDIEFSIVEYLKTPLAKDEIISLSQKLGKPPSEFVRLSEADFKTNQLHKYLQDDKKMAECIEQYHKIMERPILVKGNKAVIGRPPENILSLLS